VRLSRAVSQRPLRGDSSVRGISPWPASGEAGYQSEGGLAGPRDSAATLGLVKADYAMDNVQGSILCD